MDTAQIVELVERLVSNLGFPIACCIAMFVCCMLMLKEMSKEREAHQAESAKWVEALNNNTQALNLIKERLQRD